MINRTQTMRRDGQVVRIVAGRRHATVTRHVLSGIRGWRCLWARRMGAGEAARMASDLLDHGYSLDAHPAELPPVACVHAACAGSIHCLWD